MHTHNTNRTVSVGKGIELSLSRQHILVLWKQEESAHQSQMQPSIQMQRHYSLRLRHRPGNRHKQYIAKDAGAEAETDVGRH